LKPFGLQDAPGQTFNVPGVKIPRPDFEGKAMTRTASRLILAAIFLSLSAPAGGDACSCAGGLPTPAAFKSTPEVFIGKVIEISQPRSEIIRGSDGSTGIGPALPSRVRLSVEESLKGLQGGEVDFELGGDNCAYQFEAGERYLVYADWRDNKLRAGKCNRTRPISRAAEDLKYIKGLANNESQATLYGDVFREALDQYGKLAWQTPFEELTVIAESEEARLEVTSEKSGEFEITLRPGKYKVWVERKGRMVTKSVEEIELKEGDCERKMLGTKFDK
jgi:hypothetical protein